VTGIFALSFPLVWERMLFVALGSAELPQLPRGRYRRTDGREEQATSFRLDLLLDAEHRGQRVRVVLDAKDYQPGKLPVHEAINKQILYRLLLARQSGLPLDRVGNAFLAPAVVERSDGVSVHAVHDLEGEMGQAEAVGRIIALEVDFARVASAYVRGRPDQHLRGTVVELVMGAFATSERARFPKE
jgi:hypothetical protein